MCSPDALIGYRKRVNPNANARRVGLIAYASTSLGAPCSVGLSGLFGVPARPELVDYLGRWVLIGGDVPNFFMDLSCGVVEKLF